MATRTENRKPCGRRVDALVGRLRDFKLVLLAVEEAINNGVTDEGKVLTWACHYGKRFGMTKRKAAEMLSLSMRALMSAQGAD